MSPMFVETLEPGLVDSVKANDENVPDMTVSKHHVCLVGCGRTCKYCIRAPGYVVFIQRSNNISNDENAYCVYKY